MRRLRRQRDCARESGETARENGEKAHETAEREKAAHSSRPDSPCEVPELITQEDSWDQKASALAFRWAHNTLTGEKFDP